MDSIFQEYQSYKRLCQNNASFIEFSKKDSSDFENTTNLREFLKENESFPLPFCEVLSMIYQVLKVFADIQKEEIIYKSKSIQDNSRYALNIGNWYLKGSILRTDNFHPKISILIYNKEEIEKAFKYGSETKLDDVKMNNDKAEILEKNLLYDVAVLFYRLLKGEFAKDKKLQKTVFVQKHEDLNQEIKEIIENMMNFKINLIEEGIILLQEMYKKYIFSIFLDSKPDILYPILKDYTFTIHKFINSMPIGSSNTLIKTNLILGHLTVFLKKILSLPISYENFDREIFVWIDEIEQENKKYEEFYENYHGMVSIYLMDQLKIEKKEELKSLEALLQDYDLKNVVSLRQIETFASSYIFDDKKIDSVIKNYNLLLSPLRNYDKNLKDFLFCLKTISSLKKTSN